MEKRQIQPKTIYTIAVGVLWLMILLVPTVMPQMVLPLWMTAVLAVPPLALTATTLHERTTPMWAMSAWMILAAGLLYGTTGILLFMLAFGGVLAAGEILRRTPNFLPVFLGGSAIYMLCVVIAAALLVHEHYGVFDFQGAYRALERLAQSANEQAAQYILQMTGEQNADFAKEMISQANQLLGLYITQIFIVLGTLLMGAYMWMIKAAQFLTRDRGLIPLVPVRLFIVQRSVTVAFLLTKIVEIFSGDSNYYYALRLANTLLGFLFVMGGIGLIDMILSTRGKGEKARMTVKIILFGLAIFGVCTSSRLVYTVTAAMGVLMGLSGNFMSFRLRNREDDTDDKEDDEHE